MSETKKYSVEEIQSYEDWQLIKAFREHERGVMVPLGTAESLKREILCRILAYLSKQEGGE